MRQDIYKEDPDPWSSTDLFIYLSVYLSVDLSICIIYILYIHIHTYIEYVTLLSKTPTSCVGMNFAYTCGVSICIHTIHMSLDVST